MAAPKRGDNLLEGNVISGNGRNGIDVGGTNGNVLRGNLIGSDAGGTVAIPNDSYGVRVSYRHADFLVEGNLVSGNGSHGIRSFASGSRREQRRLILGNLIGTDATGARPLPNSGDGINLDSGSRHVIGGDDPGAENVIAFNLGDGVRVSGVDSFQDAMRGNSIFSNGGKGIELETGGNLGLESPVIAGLSPVSGTACPACTVDVYSDGEDEGRLFHGSTVADGSGRWTFGGQVSGPNVTATSTDPEGNTSEFSAPLALPTPAPAVSSTPTAVAPPAATPAPSPTPVALGVSQFPSGGGSPNAATGSAGASLPIAGTIAVGVVVLLALSVGSVLAVQRTRGSNRH